MGLFTTAITYVGWFIQFLTFSCLICGTYISAAKGWFSAKLTMNATHLITQAYHLTVLAMNNMAGECNLNPDVLLYVRGDVLPLIW